MSRFIILVLDGFGVGAMEDVPMVRPTDIGANTLLHLLEAFPDLKLPNMEQLGLMNVLGKESAQMRPVDTATYGWANLMHDGADTFFGHQEIMGTLPVKPFGEPIAKKLAIIAQTLRNGGFSVREQRGGRQSFLIVNDAVSVADNIECDPGQAFNVTAAIDIIPFETVLEIGKLVRSVCVVPRVIAFGGRSVTLKNLLDAVEEHGEYIGINAPRSGVYNCDYHCVHLGYGVDEVVQVSTILGKAGVPVFLLGKAADVIQNEYGVSQSIVPTNEVLQATKRILQQQETAFICANVQETDLCGHRERADKYVEILQIADAGIGEIIPLLQGDDVLIVMADHGNDPTIGHPHHTRERVPMLIHGAHCKQGCIGVRSTLSDVAATAAVYFGTKMPQNGTPITQVQRTSTTK
ncbi:MAG: phosphopentomutase [Oscillospiraceae bacterium]